MQALAPPRLAQYPEFNLCKPSILHPTLIFTFAYQILPSIHGISWRSTLLDGWQEAFPRCRPSMYACLLGILLLTFVSTRVPLSSSTYLISRLDPAVYPHSVQRIYPTVRPGPRAEHVLIPSPSAIVVALPVSYPRFDICKDRQFCLLCSCLTVVFSDPAVYPHNLTIYPSATEDRQSQVIVTKLPVHYPSFEICGSSHSR